VLLARAIVEQRLASEGLSHGRQVDAPVAALVRRRHAHRELEDVEGGARVAVGVGREEAQRLVAHLGQERGQPRSASARARRRMASMTSLPSGQDHDARA